MVSTSLTHVRAGQLRALGITSAKRSVARTHHNHVTLLSSAHEPIRLRTAIPIPFARIISFLEVGTLTRSENTS